MFPPVHLARKAPPHGILIEINAPGAPLMQVAASLQATRNRQ